MAVYVFSLVVGYLPHGVDNAQGYRAQILKDFPGSIKYVFTDLPRKQDIDYYSRVGIHAEEMLSVHQYFTDARSLRSTVKTRDKLEELKKSLLYTDVKYLDNEIRLLKNGTVLATIMLDENEKDYCCGTQYFSTGKLIRTEKYMEGACYIEYYITAKSGVKSYAKLVRRTFCNCEGAVAYNQIFEGKKEWYLFPDGRILTKSQLLAEFVRKLNLTQQDTVLLDRSAQFDFVQPLFQFGNKARFISVFHSGHYFEKGEDTNRLYLNYEYYYWFKYTNHIDAMVVSTQEQKIELIEKLQEYGFSIPEIEVIPAGGIDCLRYPETDRRPYSLISVSRLDKRKKIDWIIRSVIKAHQMNPEISLDIYGRGNGEHTQYLQNIVSSNQAQSYIRFMGQVDVAEIYKNYEVFITASLWETLGLSMMEAVASGMAMIGLDVKYGNRLFIQPDVNGALVDFDVSCLNDEEKLITEMAKKIVDIFSDKERLEKFHQCSYKIAKNFFSEMIQKKWMNLIARKA